MTNKATKTGDITSQTPLRPSDNFFVYNNKEKYTHLYKKFIYCFDDLVDDGNNNDVFCRTTIKWWVIPILGQECHTDIKVTNKWLDNLFKKETTDPEVVGGDNGRKLQNQTQINHFVHSVQSNWLKSDILGTTSEKNK